MKAIITLCLALSMSFAGFSQNERITKVANDGLVSFLNDIPQTFLKQHGFNSTAEFSKAKLGAQYQIMALGKDGSLTPTGFYYVTVTVDGEYRTLLTVGELDGKLDIQGVGYSPLSKELQEVEKAQRVSSNLTNVLVNDYTNKATYVTYVDNASNERLQKANFIPLASAKQFLGEATNSRLKPTYKVAELVTLINAN